MAPDSGMRNRWSRHAKARWGIRVLSVVGAAGVFSAFGLGPWGITPSAHADPLTDLFDLLIEPAITASSAISPTEFIDPGMVDAALSDLPATTNAWDTMVADLSSVGAGFGGVADTGAAVSGVAGFAEVLEQGGITSPLGSEVDSLLNGCYAQVDSGPYAALIGEGGAGDQALAAQTALFHAPLVQALTASGNAYGNTEAASTESMLTLDLQKLDAALISEAQKIDAVLTSDAQSADAALSLSEKFIAAQEAAFAEQLRDMALSIQSAANAALASLARNVKL